MTRSKALTVFAFAAVMLVHHSSAAPTLYYSPTGLSHGLGRPSSSQFTQTVITAFGAENVIEIPNFDDVAAFSGGDALFVNAREMTDVLSAAEQTNLANFISGGGAVFFVGEHGSWTNWDNSFLNLYGDTFGAWAGVGAALATNAAPDQFTLNSKILFSNTGAIAGGNGVALYTSGYNGYGTVMSALYGPNHNAIAMLDTSPFTGFSTEHVDFYNSVASWLHATASAYDLAEATNPPPGNVQPVPESGVIRSLIAALAALFLWHHRRLRTRTGKIVLGWMARGSRPPSPARSSARPQRIDRP